MLDHLFKNNTILQILMKVLIYQISQLSQTGLSICFTEDLK